MKYKVCICRDLWVSVEVDAESKKHAEFMVSQGDYDAFIDSTLGEEVYYSATQVNK